MEFKETLKYFIMNLKYVLIIIGIIVIGVVLFYIVMFNEPIVIEPTISLDELENVSDSKVNINDNGIAIINDHSYEMYCKLDLGNEQIKELSIGEPIAYTFYNGQHYYSYYCPITNLPDGQWLVSFKENGSYGEINKKIVNIYGKERTQLTFRIGL